MNEKPVINRIALFFIIGATATPTILGPLLNVGQFMGGEHGFLPLLKKGLVPMIIGTIFGYLLLKLILKRIQNIDIENRFKIIIEGSLLIYFPLIIAWAFCQVTDIIIENSFFNDVTAPWYDTILTIPILVWFALFPCAIVSLCYGLVLMLILKKN